MNLHADIYHFKTTCLLDKKDNPYRIIAIEKYKNLTELSEAILNSFNFGCNHCFGFYDNIKTWANSKVCYEHFVDLEDGYAAAENAQSPKETTIETAFLKHNKFLFLYDYGDEWHFLVELINKSEIEEGKTYPFTLETHGKAPKQY